MDDARKTAVWYCSLDGVDHGPLTASELKALAAAGELRENHLVWKDGNANRVAAGNVRGLFRNAEATTTPRDAGSGFSAEKAADPSVRDVFLSYSSNDKTTADAVCAGLENDGIRCWVAPRDILPGSNWGEAIIEGIVASRVMVIILSAASNSSPQVLREVERAVSKGIPIIPFRIENIVPSKSMEYYLSTPHWLDAMSKPLENHIRRLSQSVRALLGANNPGAVPGMAERVANPAASTSLALQWLDAMSKLLENYIRRLAQSVRAYLDANRLGAAAGMADRSADQGRSRSLFRPLMLPLLGAALVMVAIGIAWHALPSGPAPVLYSQSYGGNVAKPVPGAAVRFVPPKRAGRLPPKPQPVSPTAAKAEGPDRLLPVEADGDGRIDLLRLIDPKRDAVAGEWKWDGSTLITGARPCDRLEIPFEVPAEYRLTIVSYCRSHSDALHLGLVAGSSQVLVVLDGSPKTVTCLRYIDGRDGPIDRGSVLRDGEPNVITCEVRANRVSVDCNGTRVIDWTGDFNRLSLNPIWKVTDAKHLFIGSWDTHFEISKLELSPISPAPPQPAPMAQDAVIRAEQAAGTPAYEGSRAGEERDDNALKLKLCWCPAGTMRGFWIGKYEVTQSEWAGLMGGLPSHALDKGKGDRYPIYYVSHDNATKFCRKLTDLERNEGRLPSGWAYRLPTDAQWEHACRAGTTTLTAFGDKLDSTQANFCGEWPLNGAPKGPALGRAAEAGSYRPNAWGICDMHGNVGEFVATPGRHRGGSWYDSARNCESEIFIPDPPNASEHVGFRVARVPSEN